MPTDIKVQIDRRRQRAREEITKISNRGSHPLFSQFEVSSVSGRSYRVEIRSLKMKKAFPHLPSKLAKP